MTTNRIVRLLLVFYASACLHINLSIAAPFGVTTTAFGSTAVPYQAGKIIDPVICRSDPGQSYALYIPAKGNKDALPVIYFFDAHGAGALPLNKYKSLADEYGFILIGSNNSKNGNDWPTTEKIWRLLQEDTRKRLNINRSRIYTCGFSGGAKVASYVALKDPIVKGVIANGAGLPDGTPAGDFPFSFTAIAGEGDMNLTELVAINNEFDHHRTRHRIILFDGKHEWAPERTMNMAFGGLQFDAMQARLLPKDNESIDRYLAKSKSRFELYYNAGQLIKAGQECTISISFFDGLTNESDWFKGKLASLAGNTLYQKQRQEQEELLGREQNTKAEYMQHFQQADRLYWTKTITDLQTRAEAKMAESAMYQRLLAYLSLAFYSLSNQLIYLDRNIEARQFVELYKMADPSNSEAWYLSALLKARDNLARAAEGDLLTAAGLGFNDENRMLRQPEFKNLSGQIDFSRIKSRMHAAR